MYTPYPMRLKAGEPDGGGVSRNDGLSVIENGASAGTALAEFLKCEPAALGTRAKRFGCLPLFIELKSGGGDICAEVHPSETCVPRKEKQYGRTKWYIMEYFVPSGAGYAVCRAVTRCETNGDPEKQERSLQASLYAAEKNGNIITHMAHDKYFSVYELRFKSAVRMTMNERSFNMLTFISGEGTIECGGIKEKFAAGQSFFIPCPATEYQISGAGTAIMCKLEGDNMHKTFDK